MIRRRPINVALDITSRRSVSGGVRYTNETKESIPDQYNTATPIIKWLPVQLYEAVFEKTTFSGSVS